MRRAVAGLSLCSLILIGATCQPQRTDSGVTPIVEIQGEGHYSPLTGETVTVEGIVTAIRSDRRGRALWLQAERSSDGDASRGLMVFTREDHAAVPGELWRVRGEVTEFGREGMLPVTQVVAESLDRVGVGRLPQPVRIGNGGRTVPAIVDDDGLTLYEPAEDAIDFWESLEGMMVEIVSPVVVGPTSRFGDFVVMPEGEAKGAVRSRRGGVLLRPERENPARIVVDTSILGEAPQLEVGARLEGPVRGVLHYDFGMYRVVATEPIPAASPAPSVSTSRLRTTPSDLTVATYNVLNLTARDPARRFEAVARSIVNDLGAPDIVGLQEIQDDSGGTDDGIVSAGQTLSRLVEAIEAAGGPRYVWRQIDPIDNADGGAPGSNIRVAFLLNADRVEIVDRGMAGPEEDTAIAGEGQATHLTLSPGRFATRHPCFVGRGSSDEAEGTRKPLANEILFRNERYFIVNTHLKSKRGDDAVFGPIQPPRRRTEEQRSCQTEVVAGFVSEIMRRDPEARVIVLGDLNEHEFRPPLRPLLEAGLVNLIEHLPVEDRYTYNYLGNSQVLDHVLVSPSLAGRSRAVVLHVNSVLPDALAASDHDPVLAVISND
jgi:uncharacterized protein